MRYQCLNSAPICTGYVAGSAWGKCVANIAQCATNYGTGGNVDMRYQCLNSAPICTGYVAGSAWGKCVAKSA